MNVMGRPRPQRGIGGYQRVDLDTIQLVPLLAETSQRPNRVFAKAMAEIFVSQQASDNQLDGSLRHI